MQDVSQTSIDKLLRYKRKTVSAFTDFMNTPQDQLKEKFPMDYFKTKVEKLVNAQRDNSSIVIPMLQWQVGSIALAVHSYNVSSVSLLIGQQIGLSHNELIDLMLAALFHDIGKIYINKDIVNKSGILTEVEAQVMKLHPKVGEIFLLEHYPEFGDEIIQSVLMHHERLDGNGYYGYKSEDIIPYARIISVADILCAICEERVYHPAKAAKEGINILQSMPGLDQKYIDICVDFVEQYEGVMQLL